MSLLAFGVLQALGTISLGALSDLHLRWVILINLALTLVIKAVCQMLALLFFTNARRKRPTKKETTILRKQLDAQMKNLAAALAYEKRTKRAQVSQRALRDLLANLWPKANVICSATDEAASSINWRPYDLALVGVDESATDVKTKLERCKELSEPNDDGMRCAIKQVVTKPKIEPKTVLVNFAISKTLAPNEADSNDDASSSAEVAVGNKTATKDKEQEEDKREELWQRLQLMADSKNDIEISRSALVAAYCKTYKQLPALYATVFQLLKCAKLIESSYTDSSVVVNDDDNGCNGSLVNCELVDCAELCIVKSGAELSKYALLLMIGAHLDQTPNSDSKSLSVLLAGFLSQFELSKNCCICVKPTAAGKSGKHQLEITKSNEDKKPKCLLTILDSRKAFESGADCSSASHDDGENVCYCDNQVVGKILDLFSKLNNRLNCNDDESSESLCAPMKSLLEVAYEFGSAKGNELSGKMKLSGSQEQTRKKNEKTQKRKRVNLVWWIARNALQIILLALVGRLLLTSDKFAALLPPTGLKQVSIGNVHLSLPHSVADFLTNATNIVVPVTNSSAELNLDNENATETMDEIYEPNDVEKDEPNDVEKDEPNDVDKDEPNDVDKDEPNDVDKDEPEASSDGNPETGSGEGMGPLDFLDSLENDEMFQRLLKEVLSENFQSPEDEERFFQMFTNGSDNGFRSLFGGGGSEEGEEDDAEVSEASKVAEPETGETKSESGFWSDISEARADEEDKEHSSGGSNQNDRSEASFDKQADNKAASEENVPRGEL